MSLAVAICQHVHDYEWKNANGAFRAGGRRHACLDCLRVALAVEQYLDEALTSEAGYAALQAGPAAVLSLIGRAS